MTGTIDVIVSDELTLAYVAKNIAPYLQVTAPEEPPEWKQITRRWAIRDAIFENVERLHSAYLFFFDREGYKQKKECIEQEKRTEEDLLQEREKDDTKFKEELQAYGIVTQQELDAHTAAYCAARFLVNEIRGTRSNNPTFDNRLANRYNIKESDTIIDVVEERNGFCRGIRVAPSLFETYLRIGIKEGIIGIIHEYWVPIQGVRMPEIVNPDFEDKAVEWLKNEVYTQTSKEKECILLEKVTVRKEQDGRITLKCV